MKFAASLKNGRFHFNSESTEIKYRQHKESLCKAEPVEVVLELYKKRKKRSLNQNDTLHAWNLVLANESGMDVDEMKRETKRRCNLGDWVDFDGRKKFNPWSSADFTVEQCKLFMAEQEKLAIFLNCELPYT